MSLDIDALYEMVEAQQKRIDRFAELLDMTQEQLNILEAKYDGHAAAIGAQYDRMQKSADCEANAHSSL